MRSCGTLTILSREQGFATQHLSQDTANRPHINSFGVFLESQHNLRSSVPTSCDVFRHEARVIFLGSSRASQTKIADLEIAICIEKQVGWLEISVKNVGGVHSLESAEGLVDEILAMVIGQVLCTDNTVHIGFHKLLRNVRKSCPGYPHLSTAAWDKTHLDEINFGEGLVAAGFLDIQDGYNVLVVEVSQKLHLP